MKDEKSALKLNTSRWFRASLVELHDIFNVQKCDLKNPVPVLVPVSRLLKERGDA